MRFFFNLISCIRRIVLKQFRNISVHLKFSNSRLWGRQSSRKSPNLALERCATAELQTWPVNFEPGFLKNERYSKLKFLICVQHDTKAWIDTIFTRIHQCLNHVDILCLPDTLVPNHELLSWMVGRPYWNSHSEGCHQQRKHIAKMINPTYSRYNQGSKTSKTVF